MLCGYLIIRCLFPRPIHLGGSHSCRDGKGRIMPRIPTRPAILLRPVRALASLRDVVFCFLSPVHLLRLQPVEELGREIRNHNVRAGS